MYEEFAYQSTDILMLQNHIVKGQNELITDALCSFRFSDNTAYFCRTSEITDILEMCARIDVEQLETQLRCLGRKLKDEYSTIHIPSGPET